MIFNINFQQQLINLIYNNMQKNTEGTKIQHID